MKEQEKGDLSRKGLMETVRSLLGLKGDERRSAPVLPSEATVERLITKASGEKPASEGETEGSRGAGEKEKVSCPMATKRALVTSLNEIKAFALRHNLGSLMVRALLALLAEMALGAMKGKVSGKVLESLLKAVTYETAVAAAYEEGSATGRQEALERELLPKATELPVLNGTPKAGADGETFFDLAKRAR